MIEKSNNKNIFWANTLGQTLKEHSIAVALYGHLLLKSLKFKSSIEKEMNKYLIYSALLHDIGKVSASFQNYIKTKKIKNDDLASMPMDTEASRPKTFKGPFHNEISWAYIANFIKFGSNNMTKDTIHHSVYWHHPANCSDREDTLRFGNSEILFKKVKEELKEDVSKLLDDIYIFVDDLFRSFSADYYTDNFNGQDCLKKPNENGIDRKQCPDFFYHKIDNVACNAKKQLCLNLLLESDRTVSSWEPEKLKNFLEKWKSWRPPSYKTGKFSISENFESNTKSKEQYNLAHKMVDKKLSVCGVDPAGGKTSVSLYWWHECNNEHPLMIALPRQNQVTGLFESLVGKKGDCKRVYGNKKIKIEAVFNGQRQHDNWNPKDTNDFLISDINILVFDRFLSPYYKRSQSSEFLKMLQSHMILDEFHEFKDIPKMIPSLKEILTIREWLNSGVKTLMLSGTPEPSLLKLLCVEKNRVFERTNLSPRDNHKFKLFREKKNLEKEQQFFSDCLYSFLRVKSCQEIFSHFFETVADKIKMIHSYFTVSDKKELLKEILREHGKDQSATASDKSVITSKMLQSSYNLSFNKAVVELSQPYMDCQTAGRINRFENKSNAEIHFIYNEESEKFFSESRGAGFQEIHKNWREHILSFIEAQKSQTISIRKLMESYDNFWNEDNIKKSLKILMKKQKKAIEELNIYIPKRFFSGRKTKSASLNSLFRGESRYLSACVVDDKGKPIDQLYDGNLLSESRNWFISKIKESLQTCLKSNIKCEKANKINNKKVFDYNKYIKSFGFKAERPFLCSHINEQIDQCLSENLYDEDNNSTNHQVYHKKFGLVKKDLLE